MISQELFDQNYIVVDPMKCMEFQHLLNGTQFYRVFPPSDRNPFYRRWKPEQRLLTKISNAIESNCEDGFTVVLCKLCIAVEHCLK